MYQSLALAPSPGQTAYADSGAFLHTPGAGSPVFVPPARVPSMLPYLPACVQILQSFRNSFSAEDCCLASDSLW